MGSRGQALKGSGGFREYRYHTLMRYNKVRFVVQNEGKSIKVPEMSSSRWVVYATIDKKGDLKSVSFYNGSRKKCKEIDLHNHKGLKPHVHTLDPQTGVRNDERYPVRKLNAREETRLRQILSFYERHDLRGKGHDYYQPTGRL